MITMDVRRRGMGDFTAPPFTADSLAHLRQTMATSVTPAQSPDGTFPPADGGIAATTDPLQMAVQYGAPLLAGIAVGMLIVKVVGRKRSA